MAELFRDNFDRSDRDLDGDGAWVKSTNLFPVQIRSNAATNADAGGARWSVNDATGIVPAEGFYVEFRLGTAPTDPDYCDVLFAGPTKDICMSLAIGQTQIVWGIRDGDTSALIVLKAVNFGVQSGDLFRITYNDPDAAGTNVHNFRLYQNSSHVSSMDLGFDDALTLGSWCGFRIESDVGTTPALDELSTGDLSDSVSISSINNSGVAQSNGPFVITGSNLSGVTAARVSDAGDRPYTLTINQQDDEQIEIAPWDIHASQLAPGTLTVEIDEPTVGTATRTYTQEVETGQQIVTLASANPAYMIKDIPVVADGDLLELPLSITGSSVTMQADADVCYSPAVQHGQTHIRWFYDQSTNSWDSGNVTMLQSAAPPAASPTWIGAPNPPIAKAGEVYRYEVAQLLDGDRAMTLTDSGTPLPDGFSYDDTYPEAIISASVPGGVGTTTYAGVVTLATNANGTAESAPYSLVVQGYPQLTAVNASGITSSSAELRVTTDQTAGLLHWTADSTSATTPTAEQIIAGQKADGTAAQQTGSAPVTAIGVQGPHVVSGFTHSTWVGFHFVQISADGLNTSNVASSSFYTLDEAGIPLPGQTPDTLVSFFTANKALAEGYQDDTEDGTTEEQGDNIANPEEGEGAATRKW